VGLWLKQDDGSLVEVSGGGGGGGSFDGEHVLTGDPSDPAVVESVAEGQLLYDGVESDGSGGGPHDHDDYLPLTGGTVTGDLQVDGVIKADKGTQAAPAITFEGATTGLYGTNESVTTAVDGLWQHIVYKDLVRIRKDIQVDGDLKVNGGTEMRSNARSVRVFTGGSGNVAQIGFTSAGGDTPAYGRLSGYEVWVDTGTTHDGLATELKVGRGTSTFYGNLRVNGTITGTLAFNIADGIDTRDVLERAETATMPAVDDEGVTTTDADVETVTVNEVVTALLSKVKELSARIEELEGN